MKVSEIAAYLEDRFPSYMKMSWDNVGLLVGLTESTVTRVLVALDITDEVIDEVSEIGAQLIISHHPLFFSCKSIVDTDGAGGKIIKLISKGISAICMHTNLDVVESGVNTQLAKVLGLENVSIMEEEGADENGVPYGLGRIGELNTSIDFPEFLRAVKSGLNANGLRYHNAGKKVRRVAVSGGSDSSDLAGLIARGCDTVVTADIKYDKFLSAKALGINLIDADHFCTENVVCPFIAELLLSKYPQLEVSISKIHGQTAKFYV